MDNHQRVLVVLLRVGAIFTMIVAASLLWRLMAALPWQVDCAIAAASALAFAYRFERGSPC
jgi:hypothetical protein